MQPTVKLHADFRPCSESAPLTLLHCSRVNCTLLTTMQPGTMPLENCCIHWSQTSIYHITQECQFISVQSLSRVRLFATHEPQHTRLPCPSPTSGVHPNQCPSSQWCHPTISSSVIPFSSCPQSFPASGSFQMSQLFASGGQSTGVSALASVLPRNTQDWFPLGWTGWISLQSKGLKSLLQHHSSKASIIRYSAFFTVQLSHPHMTTGKTTAFTRWTFVGK